MRRVLPALVALVVGLAAGAGLTALALGGGGTGPEVVKAATRVAGLPAGPVDVVIETVRLGTGFTSRHRHGGTTINLIRSGVVEIDDPASGTRRYRAGETFVEPPGRVHVIRIVSAARIDVVRLLPPGGRATTEVPSAARGG